VKTTILNIKLAACGMYGMCFILDDSSGGGRRRSGATWLHKQGDVVKFFT